MKRWMLLAGLIMPVAVLAEERAPAPLPPAKAVASMVVPDGFRVTLVAAEPDVVQPISFAIDDRGRLWVAEAFNYGEWKTEGKDRITILEQVDGKLKRTIFYEGFNYITGIEVGFGGVWVMSPPNLYFVPDRNGDDRPDGKPEVLFDGFGYKESRHNLANGFTWGPDGWLYGGHGRTSPSDVGRPGTPAAKRVHCDGGVFRIHPTRLVFENFADGTTNPWGVSFDRFGECFVSNCVNPHLFHMIPGGHYEPWRNRPSSLYAYERLPTIADHLHYAGSDHRVVGTADTLALGGGHAHCGTLVYRGGAFPREYDNAVFMCNVHGRRINADILERKGSGYVAHHGKDLMLSGDPWFMGVTLRTGPDGSVYVSDWSDTGECHTYKPDRASGRIYKISYGEAKQTKPVDLSRLSDVELVKLQLHKNDFQVSHARRLLQERNVSREPKASANLWDTLNNALANEADTAGRLQLMWAAHVTDGLKSTHLFNLLSDKDEHIRAWAVRLRSETPMTQPALDRFAKLSEHDPSPLVRLALASASQRVPLEQRWPIVEQLVRHPSDANDANLPLMYWYAIEPLVPLDPARALALRAEVPLVRQFVARRVVDDALAKGGKGDLAPLVAAMKQADEKAVLDFLRGAREGIRGRKSLRMPDGWPAVYAKLGKSPDAATRAHAVVLALVFGDPQAMADLRTVALNPAGGASERVAALEALIEKRVPDLVPVLYGQLADRATRRAAIRGLASYSDPETPKRILAVYAELTADEKPDAIATLASRKEFALALLDAVEKKAVPRGDISAFAARQVFSLADANVTSRLREVWGEVRETAADRQKQMAKYRAQLTPAALKAADPRKGRTIFNTACGNCHKLYGQGGVIGPDLTGSNRSDLDYLLLNLIDPAAEVGRDFRMSIVRTRDERIITGIVLERTPARVTIQTDKEKVVLSPEDVESVKDSPLSIMPEGQLDSLTREQVRDLFAYLTGKTQVPLLVEGKK